MSNNRIIDSEKYARMFAALANTNRLRLFMRLVSCCGPGTSCGPGAGCTPEERSALTDATCVCVGDLGQDLEVAPSTVSHHLRELQRAGLIRMERSGQRVECSVSRDILEELSRFFSPSRR